MIKYYIPKLRYRPLVDEDINLDDNNIFIFDKSFDPRYWDEQGGYYSEDCDYITLYFKDIDDYMTIYLNISYSFSIKHDDGDYYTPPYSEIYDRDVWVRVIDIEMLESEYDFSEKTMTTISLHDKLESIVEGYIEGVPMAYIG